MRVVDPTLPRYGTDLTTLQNELLHTLGSGWDFGVVTCLSGFANTPSKSETVYVPNQ
jgi:hypothetical protein